MKTEFSVMREYNDGYSIQIHSIEDNELKAKLRGDEIYMSEISSEWIEKSKEALKIHGFEDIFKAEQGDTKLKIDTDFQPKAVTSNNREKWVIRVVENGEAKKWFISATLLNKILKIIEKGNDEIILTRIGEGLDTRYTVKEIM